VRLANYTFVFALLSFLFPSVEAKADAFASKHRGEIREMVAAAIRLQEEYPRYVPSMMPGEPGSPGYKDPNTVSRECSNFLYSRFYTRFRDIIDRLDAHPFKNTRDFDDEMRKETVLRDPRKIVLVTRERINDLWRFEGIAGSSDGDFAVDYARRPELVNECAGYLDATGLR
jgi:hypothetical protein